MARIRTLKPDFCNSPSTAMLSRDARLFFVQLLTDVDDEGRCPWSAKRLAGILYPSDEEVDGALVTKWVVECEQVGMVVRYEVDGYRVLAVSNFEKHQRVSHPTPSRLPPPPDGTNPEGASEDFANDSRDVPVHFANDSGIAPESFRPEVEVEVDLGSGSRKTVSPPATDDVRTVFDTWIATTGRTDRTLLDSKRRRLITTALKAYPLEDVLDAVRGWKNSSHHCGVNDGGTTYNDLGLLLRDASHLERFRDLWRNPPKRRADGPSPPTGLGVVRRMAERYGADVAAV